MAPPVSENALSAGTASRTLDVHESKSLFHPSLGPILVVMAFTYIARCADGSF